MRHIARLDRSDERWVLLLPVYQDWEAVSLLLQQVDRVLTGVGQQARVLLVDDGSPEAAPASLIAHSPQALTSIEVLRLRRNLGHQRALCIGLAYLGAQDTGESVLIMDADGEDKPEDIPRLRERFRQAGGGKVIFAERTRRSEGLLFQAGYALYRFMHWVLTGIRVRFGNFSAVPAALLPALGTSAELWSHYAATVLKARLPYEGLPTARGTRLSGRSHMNLTSLVIHGFTALSVFAESICVRALIGLAALFVLALVAGGVIWATYAGTSAPFQGWGLAAGLVVLAFFVQCGLFLGGTCFVVLFNRSNLSFLPSRDYAAFVAEVTRVSGASPPAPSPSLRSGGGGGEGDGTGLP